jgi:hypothetical protein
VAISPAPATRLPLIRIGMLMVSVALVLLTIAWTYLGMRAIMDIGGACADGGPYVSVQPCPDGASAMLSVAIPVLILATFAATAIAVTVGAPTLILPMWVLLFGSLGWNFLEYAFSSEGVVIGWLVCGVVFELMALPALVLLVATAKVRIPGTSTGEAIGIGTWWFLYALAGAGGALLGTWLFNAWA